jgi:hypothetical protein
MKINIEHRDFGEMSTTWGAYAALRRQVFVDELGWRLPDCVDVTSSDKRGSFVLGFTRSCKLVGSLRWNAIRHGLPHAELFPELEDYFPYLERYGATLNALAVTPSFRGCRIAVDGFAEPITVAKAIVSETGLAMLKEGCRWLVVTATVGLPAIFFYTLGLRPISTPYSLVDAPRRVLNMACRLNPSQQLIGLTSHRMKAVGWPETYDDRALAELASATEKKMKGSWSLADELLS